MNRAIIKQSKTNSKQIFGREREREEKRILYYTGFLYESVPVEKHSNMWVFSGIVTGFFLHNL